VYILCRQYGGPEEGGWWYDAGDVLESWPIRVITRDGESDITEGEKDILLEIQEEMQEYTFGTCYRTSMRPRDDDYTFRFTWGEPRPFPERRPQYC